MTETLYFSKEKKYVTLENEDMLKVRDLIYQGHFYQDAIEKVIQNQPKKVEENQTIKTEENNMKKAEEIKNYFATVEKAKASDVVLALPHIAKNTIIGTLVLLAKSGVLIRLEPGVFALKKDGSQ